MFVLSEEQVEKVNKYFCYLDAVSDDAESKITQAKAELYDFLVGEKTLYKKTLSNDTEAFLFDSGIYYDIKAKRNRRYYGSKKKV